MATINIPENMVDINKDPYRGFFQQLLGENIGANVKLEFLIGSNNLVVQTGKIYAVGVSYVVLEQNNGRSYIACDLFALKFATFI